MPHFTPADLRAAADFLEKLDDASNNPDLPNVSIAIASPVLEVSGYTLGAISVRDGLHGVWVDRD